MNRSERDKMLAGELYRPNDPEIQAELAATADWLARYNVSLPPARRQLLLERLGSVGNGAEIRPPFFCDYGSNIQLGAGAFLNFNCVILDVVEVEIGEGTQIGPAVQIYAADHPRDAAQRQSGLEFGRPVRIGRNVWIGGGAILLPGIVVGDNAVIGAGSVVTRHVPAGAPWLEIPRDNEVMTSHSEDFQEGPAKRIASREVPMKMPPCTTQRSTGCWLIL